MLTLVCSPCKCTSKLLKKLNTLAVGLCLVAIIAGCQQVEEPGRQKVRYVLKDAQSAEFRNETKISEEVFCGEVNSRNSHGALTGFKRFLVKDVGVFIDGEGVAIAPKVDGESPSSNPKITDTINELNKGSAFLSWENAKLEAGTAAVSASNDEIESWLDGVRKGEKKGLRPPDRSLQEIRTEGEKNTFDILWNKNCKK